MHCGYETSANDYTFGSVKGMLATVKALVSGRYEDSHANGMLARNPATAWAARAAWISVEPKTGAKTGDTVTAA